MLYLNFGKIDCQNIFTIIDHNLVGLAIYYRDSLDNIDLVHIAVDEKYSSTGKYADKLLVLQMILVEHLKLKRVMIQSQKFMYWQEHFQNKKMCLKR